MLSGVFSNFPSSSDIVDSFRTVYFILIDFLISICMMNAYMNISAALATAVTLLPFQHACIRGLTEKKFKKICGNVSYRI